MSLKTIVTHGPRTCARCGGKIDKGVEAKADFDKTPYYFEHIKCPGAEMTEEQEDHWEMLFAILADHSMDLIKMKGQLSAIYEKLWPPQIEDLMGGKK